MSLSEWFGFSTGSTSEELPEIFPVPMTAAEFVRIDVIAIYTKILTDVLERSHGLTDEQVALMWDNCVKSNSSDGLITMLARAMAEKRDLFLVFEKSLDVIRIATRDEEAKIRADYEKKATSSVGTYVSFKNYDRSDMVAFYVGLDYCTVGSLYKSMNLSKAIQLKITDLRASVSLSDSSDAKTQAKRMTDALAAGRSVLMDAKDEIATAVPDLTATKEAIAFTVQKLSFYLGLPDSYIVGEQTSGMGTTGENDMRAVERGLKAYYFSIMKPVVEALFGVKLSYKSQDFRQIAGSMDVLKTFNLTDDTLVSSENKRIILNKLLDLPEDAKGDPPPKPDPLLIPPAAGPKPPFQPTGSA